MADVIALVPDLLFGSRVQSSLTAAGHSVRLVSTRADAQARLDEAEVLVIDLTDERIGGIELVAGLPAARPRTLGFYAHVDTEVRRRAQRAGFDLVVPRSRMAREGAELVARLASQLG